MISNFKHTKEYDICDDYVSWLRKHDFLAGHVTVDDLALIRTKLIASIDLIKDTANFPDEKITNTI